MPVNILPNQPQRIFAFVDEYGDPNLNIEKDGTTQYFICTAVILTEGNLKSADEIIKGVREKYFSGAEIKSSSASNAERRLKILAALAEIDFKYIALVVDKEKIWRDSGFQYKKTFYKQIHKRLYSLLNDLGVGLKITADQMGHKEFMDGFKAYIAKNVLPTLFNDCQFEFGDSKSINFLQLADFITGTLGHSFDPKKKTKFSPSLREALRSKELSVDAWPMFFKETAASTYPMLSRHDPFIEKVSYGQARKFIERYGDSLDDKRAAQLDALMFLVYGKWGGSDDSVPEHYHTGRIIKHLTALGHEEMNEQDFRRNVIGPLRDEGILISANKNGYMLATTLEEVEDFLKHGEMILFPMINRIDTAAKTIKLFTSGSCDILSSPEHSGLKSLVERFSDFKLEADGVVEVDSKEEPKPNSV